MSEIVYSLEIMAESGKFQWSTFQSESEEDQPKLDKWKKLKLYSSASSLSSILSVESQYSFSGTTNELVSHLRSKQDQIQKETFTRLCNQYLNVRDQINDLFTDFRTGLVLIKLLQKLSHKTVAKPSKGQMSIHFMQNLNACVSFLIEHRVYLNKASYIHMYNKYTANTFHYKTRLRKVDFLHVQKNNFATHEITFEKVLADIQVDSL